MHTEDSLNVRLPQHYGLEHDRQAARLAIHRALDRLARRHGIIANDIKQAIDDQVEDLLDYVVQPDFEIESDG